MLSNVAVRFSRNVEKMPGGRTRIIIDAPGRHKASLGVFDMANQAFTKWAIQFLIIAKVKIQRLFFYLHAIWYDPSQNECMV